MLYRKLYDYLMLVGFKDITRIPTGRTIYYVQIQILNYSKPL